MVVVDKHIMTTTTEKFTKKATTTFDFMLDSKAFNELRDEGNITVLVSFRDLPCAGDLEKKVVARLLAERGYSCTWLLARWATRCQPILSVFSSGYVRKEQMVTLKLGSGRQALIMLMTPNADAACSLPRASSPVENCRV